MEQSNTLGSIALSAVAKHGGCVSAAGIRYGSVLYLAFGQARLSNVTQDIQSKIYPVELEIGADDWKLSRNDRLILDSRFTNSRNARFTLSDNLVTQKINDIVLYDRTLDLVFSQNTVLSVVVRPSPASGFLYSLYIDGVGSWETLDGEAISDQSSHELR